MLDIDLQQCLVDFYDDDIPWHHRVLLIKGDGQRWIWLTPDGEVQAASLEDHRVRPLRRGGRYPATCVYEGVYGFDPLPATDLEGYMEDARALARILGFAVDADAAAVSGERWFVSEPSSEYYGDELPPGAITNPDVCVQRGGFALVEIGGVWTTAVKTTTALPWSAFVEKRSHGKGRDSRLLGDLRDTEGVRHMPFKEVLLRSKEVAVAGFPLRGPRAASEFVVAIRDAGQSSLDDHALQWMQRSGVSEKAGAAREHRCITIALRLLTSFDQVDLANCAGTEFMVRRLLQIEAATRRNPRQPDFEGLDGILDTAMDEHGSALVPKFIQWIGDQQRSEAQVLKAGRQWREEQASLVKPEAKGKAKKPGADS